jgi:hypothetical protein
MPCLALAGHLLSCFCPRFPFCFFFFLASPFAIHLIARLSVRIAALLTLFSLICGPAWVWGGWFVRRAECAKDISNNARGLRKKEERFSNVKWRKANSERLPVRLSNCVRQAARTVGHPEAKEDTRERLNNGVEGGEAKGKRGCVKR